ncbi:PAS domain-containing protein [Flavobacterium sp. GT3R68]|uniref:sensor histidine kinase n=1 Tax=Flavobacterium sp. GT3R68 TaxID=2594437 RepID=UPI000F8936B4|nr:PAS domain-containing protein [Flavobacterium sp. GT3R68]RTY89665.1 PAS domain S-box protein [Flavobacterium sp. GSN2]TRW89449.1 PAS domain S-box protein [Flavobacterium sp. GT3R68]
MKFDTFSDTLLLEEKIIFYKKLLSQIPDLIFQATISRDAHVNFPFLSRSVIAYFELSSKELFQGAFEIVKSRIVTDDFEGFVQSIEDAKTDCTSWFYEFRVNIPSKGLRWVKGAATVGLDENGSIIFYGRLTDITAKKANEQKLKLSEERYQFALEASTKGIWDLNLSTNEVFHSSQSMKMLGYGDSDLVNSHETWENRVHPDDKENYRKVIQMHLDGITPVYENSKRMLAIDGTYKWISSRGKVIERDKNGAPLRIIGTHTDISVEKEKEQELKRTFEIISEQNSRLLNFAHIVSHNLSSHVGNLNMLLQIINSEDDAETIKESYSHLKSTSNSLTETINHLKELMDIQSGLVHKRENLDLNYYLNHTISILGEEINENKVIIHNHIPADSTVNFNPAYLESILLNFTTNAIKYCSPDRNPEIKYTFIITNGVKSLEIKDNGLGIDLEKHGDKLYGMYKTFHKHPKSRGIGLFITKNQIEAMGGSLKIESEVGVGTTFKIYFNNEI